MNHAPVGPLVEVHDESQLQGGCHNTWYPKENRGQCLVHVKTAEMSGEPWCIVLNVYMEGINSHELLETHIYAV